MAMCGRCGISSSTSAKYRLGIGAAIGLVAWSALWVILSTVTLRAEVDFLDSGRRAPQLPLKGLEPSLASCYRGIRYAVFATVWFNALGCVCYIFVGIKAERPAQVHWHGAVLMIMLVELVLATALSDHPIWFTRWPDSCTPLLIDAVKICVWGLRRSILTTLMTQKMSALGLPAKRRWDVDLWGWALNASTLLFSFGMAAPGYLYTLFMVQQGIPYNEAYLARTGLLTGEGDVGTFHIVVLGIFGFLAALLITVLVVCCIGFVFASWYAVRAALAKMVQREVKGELLQRAQTLLRLHLIGVTISLSTNVVVILAASMNAWPPPFDGLEQVQIFWYPVAHVFDGAGDIAGILLLSGIGALLFREDVEAGDISAHIRGVLHAAVLTSRADSVFEGVVEKTMSNCCIVSFPGKFLAEWNALTWLCELGYLSSACVFLPQADPKQRFGQHSECKETPGKCWCYSLYGEPKPWGCCWFEEWRANVERAVELQLDLVCVFFPRQSGRGIVKWEDLPSANLWDGVGLGGSQKAELAYLKMKGYSVQEEDLDATRNRMSRRTICRSKPTKVVTPKPTERSSSEIGIETLLPLVRRHSLWTTRSMSTRSSNASLRSLSCSTTSGDVSTKPSAAETLAAETSPSEASPCGDASPGRGASPSRWSKEPPTCRLTEV